MTQNTMGHLNERLFEQLDRLSGKDTPVEELQTEIKRAHAVATIAQQVIATGELALKAQRFVMDTQGRSKTSIPKMLEG